MTDSTRGDKRKENCLEKREVEAAAFGSESESLMKKEYTIPLWAPARCSTWESSWCTSGAGSLAQGFWALYQLL